MIRHPLFLVLFLAATEAFVLLISSRESLKKYFNFLPHVFWIFFLPMLASTFGLIDAKSPVLGLISTFLLPMSLFLLLIGVDIKAILKLGKPALMMMLAGSFSMLIGICITFFIFKRWVGEEFWSGFGALCGSWTGGSANMIAVKEALQMPDAIFLPMLVVDTVVPYVWMGMLVACVSMQRIFDRWNHSDRRIIDEIALKVKNLSEVTKKRFNLEKFTFILVLGLAVSRFAAELAKFFPVIQNVISTYAWTIILVTGFAISLSFTRLRAETGVLSSRIGYVILYFVLTSIGARANLSEMNSALVLILAGFVIASIHGVLLVLFGRLIKAPMFLTVVASQANIGGVASAPIVAEIFQPGLAPVGLLLAIFGNIIGTYIGILAATICRFISVF